MNFCFNIFKLTSLISIIFILYLFNVGIINITYANNQTEKISQQNNNIKSIVPSNEEVKAEFKTKIVGGDAQPKEYFGNTNTYLNRMIQCTRFKADKNDPACQQFNYSAAFESFVNKNFNKDKVNEILSSVNFKTDNNTDNKNISNNTNNNNVNNNVVSDSKKNETLNNTDKNITNKNKTNKSKTITQNISVPTGTNVNVIILLILFNILIIYMTWKIIKITNKKNLIKL